MAEDDAAHFLYQASYAFEAENDAELSLQVGDVVEVFSKDGEWWEGVGADGKVGLFPANRVVAYHDPNYNATAETGGGGGGGYHQEQQYHGGPGAEAAYAEPEQVQYYEQGHHQQQGQQFVPQQQQYEAKEMQDHKFAHDGPGHGGAMVAGSAFGGGGRGMGGHVPPPLPGGAGAGAGGGGGGGAGAGAAAEASRSRKKTGGARPRVRAPSSKTRYGVWAGNMAWMTGMLMPVFGIAAIVWGVKDDDKYGLIYVLAGLYSILAGIGIVIYEKTYGQSRTHDRFPWRGVIYFLLSIFLFLAIPTLFGGLFLVAVAVVNVISAHLAEEYEPKKKRKSKKAPKPAAAPGAQAASYLDRFCNWLVLKKEQNETGALVFVSLFVLGNVAIFFSALAEWTEKNNNFPPGKKLSGFAPWAKAFGNMLDLDCALILLPVLRTIIRWLYNRSTADESCFARALRGCLSMVPLDRAIEFHKLCAGFILFGAIGHTIFHLFNWVNATKPSLDKFGVTPWITGGIICLAMLFMYAAVLPNVKHTHFEVFWVSHHLFIVFFSALILHGNNFFNPNVWKFLLGPGVLYMIERLLRVYRARKKVVLLSVTHMRPDVISLEFAKEGVFKDAYKEGQYIFIAAPTISTIEFHPFTISSAPAEKSVTLHIKIQGEGSWTRQVSDYLQAMGARGATYFELTRQTDRGLIPGKIIGPNGKPLFQIDGPHSAPTQHVSEYHTCIIAGAGIGVTPVAATLKSVVLHRWKYYLGHCFPDNAYYMWVCSYKVIDSFRWLLRAIKDCEDEIYDMRAKNAKDMSQKRFEFHIWVTSLPKDAKPVDVVVDDDIGFWGVPQEDRHIEKVRAPFTELDLYKVMKCPPGDHTVMGDVHIYKGRPKWDERFAAVAAAHPKGDIGVTFCGNPFIASDLQKQCALWSDIRQQRFFKLHKENF